jgi:hypothetical protein
MWKKEEGRPGEICDLSLSITAYTESMNQGYAAKNFP